MKKTILYSFIVLSLSSCVSSKVHKELESKYTSLKRENRRLKDDLKKLNQKNDANTLALEQLEQQYQQMKTEKDQLEQKYASLNSNYDKLKESYDVLGKNSSQALSENAKRNRELLKQLETKESALLKERQALDQLKKDLASRSKKIDELEKRIAAKDAKMQALKTAISNALRNFEGKGLSVEERDGKVYVSMENKLLFDSGSWSVGPEGKKAVRQLAEVLAENPDINILIEGHTDNVPYRGNGQVKGNWDLSTKRATAIVNLLLENSAIVPENLTAAGRSEFAPVASNTTSEGKAKNRRIEVILTPKLDEISRLLEGM